MEHVLQGLSRRESMLVLSACTFAGGSAGEVLEFLAEPLVEKLKARAQSIQQIPREKRVPFLVQEVKRLFAHRTGADLSRADPRWLAHSLRHERPQMVAVIVRGLSARVAQQVSKLLGARLKGLRSVRPVHPEVLAVIRTQLERRLARSGHSSASDRSMNDLVLMPNDALTQLVERLGALDIAPAVVSLGKEAPELFAAYLSPEASEALFEACRAVGAQDRGGMTAEQGRAWLSKYGDPRDVKNLVRRAGVKRLARACLAEGQSFLEKVARRHPGSLGKALLGWGHALLESNEPITGNDDARPDVLGAMELVGHQPAKIEEEVVEAEER
jgi:hypothetical protein